MEIHFFPKFCTWYHGTNADLTKLCPCSTGSHLLPIQNSEAEIVITWQGGSSIYLSVLIDMDQSSENCRFQFRLRLVFDLLMRVCMRHQILQLKSSVFGNRLVCQNWPAGGFGPGSKILNTGMDHDLPYKNRSVKLYILSSLSFTFESLIAQDCKKRYYHLPGHDLHLNCIFSDHAYMYCGGEAILVLHLNKLKLQKN